MRATPPLYGEDRPRRERNMIILANNWRMESCIHSNIFRDDNNKKSTQKSTKKAKKAKKAQTTNY
jgi:hypothetical protein